LLFIGGAVVSQMLHEFLNVISIRGGWGVFAIFKFYVRVYQSTRKSYTMDVAVCFVVVS